MMRFLLGATTRRTAAAGVMRRAVSTNMAAAVVSSAGAGQQQSQIVGGKQKWKEMAAAAAVSPGAPHNSATLKHLHLVSQAIEKVVLEKEAAAKGGAAATHATTVPTDEELIAESTESAREKVEEAWHVYENVFENAKSCVGDMTTLETPEHWREEMESVEEAITQAQAAYVDVLDIARECEDQEDRREEAAVNIRQLRRQLDALAKPEETSATM